MSNEQAPGAERKEIIIVAEDSPSNRKILVHLLQKLDYEVIECDDGLKAWNELNKLENSDRVVAVLSDIMMPNKDGLTLLKDVRTSIKFKSLPFVLITAVSERENIMTAKNLQVQGYILKPVTFQRVIAKLQELFPNRTFPKVAA